MKLVPCLGKPGTSFPSPSSGWLSGDWRRYLNVINPDHYKRLKEQKVSECSCWLPVPVTVTVQERKIEIYLLCCFLLKYESRRVGICNIVNSTGNFLSSSEFLLLFFKT